MVVRLIIGCVVVALGLGCFTASGQQGDEFILGDPTFRVSLDVSCDDEAAKTNILRYVRNSLRSLDGVSVVTSDAEFVIDLVVVSNSGIVAIAVLFQSPGIPVEKYIQLCHELFEEVMTPNMETSLQNIHYGFMRDHARIWHVGVITVGLSKLESSCESIVSDFDSICCEPRRALYQQIRDANR